MIGCELAGSIASGLTAHRRDLSSSVERAERQAHRRSAGAGGRLCGFACIQSAGFFAGPCDLVTFLLIVNEIGACRFGDASRCSPLYTFFYRDLCEYDLEFDPSISITCGIELSTYFALYYHHTPNHTPSSAYVERRSKEEGVKKVESK